MTPSTIATIVVIAFLIFFLIFGYIRGFLKIILTTMALVVTIVVAGLLAPTVAGLLESSFIGKNIDKRIGTYLEKTIDDPVVNSVDSVQNAVIDKLPLPKYMREDIRENNTAGEYVELKVTNFTGYLRTRLVTIIVKVIACVLLLIVIYVIIRILLRISGAINKIPIIGGINRIFGAIIGLLEGLLILWCICLIITMFASTKFGMQVVDVINGSKVLKFIYDRNGIAIGINALFHSLL